MLLCRSSSLIIKSQLLSNWCWLLRGSVLYWGWTKCMAPALNLRVKATLTSQHCEQWIELSTPSLPIRRPLSGNQCHEASLHGWDMTFIEREILSHPNKFTPREEQVFNIENRNPSVNADAKTWKPFPEGTMRWKTSGFLHRRCMYYSCEMDQYFWIKSTSKPKGISKVSRSTDVLMSMETLDK